MSLHLHDEDAHDLRAAAAGDDLAWARLVDRHAGLIWNLARGHGLSAGDAADVSQTTWLRLVENIDRLEDGKYVGRWLAATARHECRRLLARTDEHPLLGETGSVADAQKAEAPAPRIAHGDSFAAMDLAVAASP